jgi:hypothetical protein
MRLEVKLLSSAAAAAQSWFCEGPLFVMPFTDPVLARRAALLMSARAGAGGLMLAVHDDVEEGFICIANRIFLKSDSPYFGYVAQDAFPGRYWLKHAIALFGNPSVHLIAFNDGKWFGAMAAYGLARRLWASRNYGGPLFYPGYRRHYADAELSLIAAEAGALGYNPHSILVETDLEKDGKPVDARDRKTFRARAATKFDKRIQSSALVHRFR